MIEIDGSYGEGGGQILRTAVAMSILTGEDVKIRNIRANRPNPGLRAQHLTALKALQMISDARVEGLHIGSSWVNFSPGKIKGGSYKLDIGTAGSITLVFQSILLASLQTEKELTFKVRGGTDVKWSPSWDYFTEVFIPLLSKFGFEVEGKLLRRGFYPKGGGEVEVIVHPTGRLKSFQVLEQEYRSIEGRIAVSKLPNHVGERTKQAILRKAVSYDVKIDIERADDTLSEGVVATLWSKSKETVVGSTMLGEKGLPSEKLGSMCIDELIKEIESKVSLDVHAADQLLPYMAFVATHYGEKSTFLVRELSNHARTNMWLIEKFLPVKFITERKGNVLRVEVVKSS